MTVAVAEGDAAELPGLSRTRRLLVLGALYLVANVGFSFFFLTLGTILLGRGASLGTVALINLLGTIYFCRVLVAPVVDRFGLTRFGHYRGWLILTQLGLTGTLVGLSALDPIAELPVLLGLMVLILVLSVFHDVALNGMAIRLLHPADHGIANGIQVASGSASMLIGSSGALLLYTKVGWPATLVALAVLFVLPLAVLARLREPSLRGVRRKVKPHTELFRFFRRRGMTVWTLMIIPVFGVGMWLSTAAVPAMLLAADWQLDRIAIVQSLSSALQVVAALVAGVAVTRYGGHRPALLAGLLGFVSVACLVPVAAGSAPLVPTTAVLTATYLAYGAKLTVISAVSMHLARPESASTDFSIPMSIEGISVTLVGSLGLGLAGAIGFPWVIGAAACLGGVGVAVAPGWIRRHGNVQSSCG